MLSEIKNSVHNNYDHCLKVVQNSKPVQIAFQPEIFTALRQAKENQERFDKEISILDKEIETWKNNHGTPVTQFQSNRDPSDHEKVTRRKILIGMAIIVSTVAGGILGITGLIISSAGMLTVATFGAMADAQVAFPCGAAVALTLLLSGAMGIPVGIGMFFAGGVLFIPVLWCLQDIVCRAQIKARINKDEFKQFITDCFPENGDFYLDDKMIKDRTLHEIYTCKYSPLLCTFRHLIPKKP